MLIHILPPEIIAHIFHYIPDKMNTSMTCKLFQTILQNTKHTENINDPYYLSKNFNMCYDVQLELITNYNCLNFITYIHIMINKYNIQNNSVMSESDKFAILSYFSLLLHRHCDINNVSKPDYINILCISLQEYNRKFLADIITLKKYLTSPDVVLLIFPYIKSIYFSLISFRLGIINLKPDDIYTEIDFFVENNVLTYEEIDEELNIQRHIKKYNGLCEYIKKKLKS